MDTQFELLPGSRRPGDSPRSGRPGTPQRPRTQTLWQPPSRSNRRRRTRLRACLAATDTKACLCSFSRGGRAAAGRACRTCRRQRVIKRGAPRGARSRPVRDLAAQRAGDHEHWRPMVPAQTSGVAPAHGGARSEPTRGSYERGSMRGSPKRGNTALSKCVSALIRPPDSVRTSKPVARPTSPCASWT